MLPPGSVHLHQNGPITPIAVGACTTFPKAIITVFIEDAFAVEPGQVAPPGLYVFTPFEDNRLNAFFEQEQGGEEAGGACPDDHHPVLCLANVLKLKCHPFAWNNGFIYKNPDAELKADLPRPCIDG